jgi:DNA-binding transcriptional ArsR family regulator
MKSSTAKQQRQVAVRRNEQKWTAELWEAGWLAIPNIIVEKQQELGLDSRDINILLHLIRYWWHRENLPHPTKRTIAECMGVDMSTVRRHIAAMEKKGLIHRIERRDGAHGQKSNYYDFSGLINASVPHAREAIKLREKRQAEDARRRKGTRPRLTVVSSSKTDTP